MRPSSPLVLGRRHAVLYANTYQVIVNVRVENLRVPLAFSFRDSGGESHLHENDVTEIAIRWAGGQG